MLPKKLFYMFHIVFVSLVCFFHDKFSVRTGAHCYFVLVKSPSREIPIILTMFLIYMKELYDMKHLYLLSYEQLSPTQREGSLQFPSEVLNGPVTDDSDLYHTAKWTSFDTHQDKSLHVYTCPKDILLVSNMVEFSLFPTLCQL